MAKWTKCTGIDGKAIFINLNAARTIFWNEDQQHTVIAFPADEESVHVLEQPEIFLKIKGQDPNA